jgi:hypothetical protein
MIRQKGAILLLMLISIFFVVALGLYFYLQGGEETGQLKKAVKFASVEEAESLMLLDKAAHTWIGQWAKDSGDTIRNYESIPEYDVRYEIPIDELIGSGLLPASFAYRFNDVGESVYGLPYTSSVIKRKASTGVTRQCQRPDDRPEDCEHQNGGVCTPIDLLYGRCVTDVTEDKYSILTTIGTKGAPIPEPPEMTCPFYTEYDDGRGFYLAVNAYGVDSFELEGSCHDYYDATTVRTQARDYLLNAVNVQNTAVLTDGIGTYSHINVASYGNVTVELECALATNTSHADYIRVANWIDPKIMDSYVYCDITRRTAPPSCDVNVSYCANDVYDNYTNTISIACSASQATAIENSLNTGGFAYRPYSEYPVDNPWVCNTLGNNINCSASSNCGGSPPGVCPAFLNYTKDSALVEDKVQFKTYPGACSAYITQAENEVAGFFDPAYLWQSGPTCTPAINGMGDGELICVGSEAGSGSGSGDFCDVYFDDGGSVDHDDTYPDTNCYGDIP